MTRAVSTPVQDNVGYRDLVTQAARVAANLAADCGEYYCFLVRSS